MRINADLINSLNENYVELGGTWLWSDKDVYSFDYLEILTQPVSLDCITLDFLRFKDDEVTLTIRSGITSATPLVYLATTQTLPDSNQNLVHNSLQGLQGTGPDYYHISASTYGYLSAVSADVQTQFNNVSASLQTSSTNLQNQITNNKNSLSAYLPLSGGTLTGQLKGTTISASGSVSALDFSDFHFVGSKALVSNGKTIVEATASTTEINYLQNVSANIQTQINSLKQNSISGIGFGTVHKVVKFVTTSSVGDSTISDNGSLVQITNNVSASGNISGNSFVKIGGTSSQFLKADGSIDSNVYTITATTSAISANLQNQITSISSNYTTNTVTSGISASLLTKINSISANYTTRTEVSGVSASLVSQINLKADKTSLSAYLPLSGGTLSGQLKTTSTISASDVITGSAFVRVGGLVTQFLKADGSLDSNVYTTTATTSAISANLQNQINLKADKTSLSAYLPLSGGTLTGQLLIKSQLSASGDLIGSRHIIPGGLSTQFLKADGSVDSNSYALDTLGDYYLPLSGGTLGGDVVSQNIRPTAPFFNDLGSVFFPYASLYVSSVNANKINMEGSIIPINSLLYDLGSDSYKWNKIYTKDITSVAMSTVFDRAVEAVDIKSHLLIGFDNQLAPHLNFSNSLGTSATLSGDCYFDGLTLKIRDKNLSLKTFAYTTDLSAYTPTSGFSQTISAYLPLSGGTLTGLLKGTSVSASGNITATNFVGNLEGYKNVDGGNEATISNGYAHSSQELYINYRGATSAINNYNFCNGKGSTLASIKAAGGTLTGNLKISAVSEGWSEGIKVMVPSGSWGGFRLTRSSSLAGTEDNWSIGYRADSTGDLLFGNYTGGSDKEHTIFYKNGDVYHSGNITAVGAYFSNDLRLTKAGNNGQLYMGTGTAGIGYNGSSNQFILSGGDFVPYDDIGNSLGSSSFRWKNTYSQNFYGNFYGNVSAGNISATNLISNSSIILKSADGTIDKTKIYENQVLLRNEDSRPFAGISGSYLSSSGTFLTVFGTDPSSTPILKSECLYLTSGFGINGKSTYLKTIPTVNSGDSITNQTIAIRNILEAYGLINVI